MVGTNYTTHTNVDIRTRSLKSGKLHNAFFSEDKSIVYIKRFPPFQILQDPPIYFCSKLFPVDPRKKAPCSLPQFSQESISSAFRHHFSPPILQDSKWRNKEQERMRPAALCTLLHTTAMWWLHANVRTRMCIIALGDPKMYCADPPHQTPPNLPEIQRKREIQQKWGIRGKWANRAELKCGLAWQPAWIWSIWATFWPLILPMYVWAAFAKKISAL